MKKRQIKVGSRQTGREPFLVNVLSAETWQDALKLAGGSEPVAVALFNRGLDIWRQDRIGRPMFAEKAKAAEIEAAIAAGVPGVTKGRGRPAKAKVVALPKDWAKLTREQQVAFLTAQGLTVIEQ